MALKDFQKYVTGDYPLYKGRRKIYDFGNENFVSVIFYQNKRCEVAVLEGSKIVFHEWNLMLESVNTILGERLRKANKFKGV